MPRTIVVTSGKGGVGKTTITANLGIALAMKNQSVVLVDLDVGLNNLDLALDIECNIVFDLADCLEGKCRLGQALVQHPKCKNLFILACNNTKTKNMLENNICRVIAKLKEHFDWILVDSPAGIDNGFLCATKGCDESLVVVTPHASSLRDSDKVINFLRSNNFQNTGIVVNRIRGDLVKRGLMMNTSQISKLLSEKVVGIIPESDVLCTTSNILSPQATENEKSAFLLLAKNLINDSFDQFDYISKYRGIFGAVRRTMRRNS